SFAVIATDAAGNASDAESVTLYILDINDTDDVPPTITSGDIASAIDENSGAEQVIYTVTADDTADISDGVTFSLVEGSDDALSINAETGAVTLATNPDHETQSQSQYSFAVIATDAAGNVSEPQSVILDINDLDDAAPTITSGDMVSAVEENSGAGQVIYTATSDDSGDDVADTPITFSLTENSDAGLSIDAETGAVTLIANPDHEAQSQYNFAVIATDAAGNASEEQSLTLEIDDLDDAAPSITSGATAVAIDENSGAGQIIYSAAADDSADDVSDMPITFSLAEGSDAALSINTFSGEVTLNTNPNYEAQSQYSFAVVASDAAGNDSVEQSVTLNVNNIDDTAPTLTSGASGLAIDENSGAGQLIYTATADDTADISGGVSFSLADVEAGFNIDSVTGDVTTNSDFVADYENASEQSFAVIATDAAGNASEAQSVTLTINNLDDTAPTITSGVTATAIDENSGSGQVVYTAAADDSNDVSSGVSFVLEGVDAPSFEIDSVTGAVTLTANPDYEAQSQYSFSVVAIDGALLQSNAQAVTLDINNVDDTAPTITSADEAIVVNAGDTDPVIYTATAEDDDAAISYSLNDTTTYAATGASASAVSTVSIPELAAATQHVYVSSSTKSEDGTQETVVVSYNADDTTTTGLGLRIHFDSSALSASDIATLMTSDLLVNAVVESDDSDLDGDASTDTYVAFGWASLFGAWPGSAPADLASITFDIAEGATGSSAINFTISSNAAGFAFDGQNHEVAITGEAAPVESQLSIDSATGEVTLSGELDPATQSEYGFTVTATDTAGNSSDLDVVVDAEQPMVDAAMVVVVDGDTPSAPIYQASANIDNISYQITDHTQYPDAGSGSGSAESQISIPELSAATQHVYVSSSTKSEDGTQETVVVSYNADDTTTTGLGLRIHFDSSVLSASDITTLMTNDLLVNAVVESDDSDLDGDASTDTYVQFGWASLFGQWPNAAPVDLASITFDIAEGATGSSAINFSISSNAAGFAFDGQDHNLVLAAEAVVPAAELVIDNAAGTVSLDAAANSDVMPAYSFTVDGTDADGDAVGSQTVPVVVVDQVVNADASSYTGTADADVFALADGSAEITSGAGEDDFVLDPAFASASHTITDFESGVDAIDISAALVAAGYNTSDNVPTQLASADMSADILDLVNGDDSSLDNLFGATYDEDSNTLTVFADSDSSTGSTDMDSFQITLDDSATVEDDDIVANLSTFIA
ncbi:cadherin repeat domain-containing protein, partial [bacterium]|nr:cadherin repeat domain-containing protein [bacterium]